MSWRGSQFDLVEIALLTREFEKPRISTTGIKFLELRGDTADRVHRIGSDKPVFVYKLIAQGTVEERMLEIPAAQESARRGDLRSGRQRRRGT